MSTIARLVGVFLGFSILALSAAVSVEALRIASWHDIGPNASPVLGKVTTETVHLFALAVLMAMTVVALTWRLVLVLRGHPAPRKPANRAARAVALVMLGALTLGNLLWAYLLGLDLVRSVPGDSVEGQWDPSFGWQSYFFIALCAVVTVAVFVVWLRDVIRRSHASDS